jgi:Zn-dependent protease with chaperone function
MRLNSGNRAFFALVAVAFVAYQLLGAGACALFGALVYGVATGEVSLGANLWGVAGGGIFLVVYVLGWLFAIGSIIRQTAATLRLRDRVRDLRLPMPDTLSASARRVGLDRVDLVDSQEPFSFAYGVLATRVAVSRGLFDKVSAAELDAVLAHERYHVRNWDPLKVFVARLMGRALFFLPVLAEFRNRYVAGRELAADRRALRAYGERPLAGALYKVVSGPLWSELGAAAAIGGPQHLDARIAQLESGNEPPSIPIPPRAWLVSIIGSAALLVSFSTAVIAFGGPFAMMNRSMMDGRREMSGPGWLWAAGFWLLVLIGVLYGLRRTRRQGRRLTTTTS